MVLIRFGRPDGLRGKFTWLALFGVLVLTVAAVLGSPKPGYAATPFADEFSGTSLDTNAWVAMNRPGDQSNAEKECYKPSNATEGGGFLTITTLADTSCAGPPPGVWSARTSSGVISAAAFAAPAWWCA